jgi:hypothetical protein
VTKDNKRTFTIDGIDFLMMWWKNQPKDIKDKVRQMINEGRIEILNGGWS